MFVRWAASLLSTVYSKASLLSRILAQRFQRAESDATSAISLAVGSLMDT